MSLIETTNYRISPPTEGINYDVERINMTYYPNGLVFDIDVPRALKRSGEGNAVYVNIGPLRSQGLGFTPTRCWVSPGDGRSSQDVKPLNSHRCQYMVYVNMLRYQSSKSPAQKRRVVSMHASPAGLSHQLHFSTIGSLGGGRNDRSKRLMSLRRGR